MEHSSGLYILNKNNELLIVHPTLGKHLGQWGIPKGKVDDGENNWQTAIRETKEETNLDITDVNEFMELPDVIYKSKKKYLSSFYVKVNDFDSETPLSCPHTFEYKGLQLPENNYFRWVDINSSELDSLMHEAQITNLNTIRKMIKDNGKENKEV